MRAFLALVLLPAIAFAQGEPEAEAKSDDWAVARPASKPAGDPVALKVALEAGKAHRIEMVGTSAIQVTRPELPPQPMNTEMTVRSALVVVKTDASGLADVEIPISITRFVMNDMDQTSMLAAMFPPGGKLTLRVDANGDPVPDTVKAVGLGMMGPSLEKDVGNPYCYLPAKPVRVGEVWDVPAAKFASEYASAETQGATYEGEVYAVIEAVEPNDGVACARIRVVYSIRLSGNPVSWRGTPGKGDGRVKGESVFQHDLSGYGRGSTHEQRVSLKLVVMGQELSIGGTNRKTFTGGPEAAPTAPAAPSPKPPPGPSK